MRTSSRDVALVLFDEVELLDAAGPSSALSAAGRQWNFRPFKLHPVARASGFVETRSQMRLEARYDFTTCPPPEILVVPGGYGARRALADGATMDFVARAGAEANFVLAVGAGVLLLGEAGLLDGVAVAVGPDHRALVAEHCPKAIVSDDALVDAGKVMTASRSGGALGLSIALVRKLLGPKLASQLAASLGHELAAEAVAAPEILEIIPRDTKE